MSESLNYDAFISLNIVLTLTSCADPDKMQHSVTFHLDYHKLPKYDDRLTTVVI